MFQRLPIALSQVKVGDTSENVLNGIRKKIFTLCQEKGITKKVYNNIMNSINLQNRVDTVFMNSKTSGTFDPHKLKVK